MPQKALLDRKGVKQTQAMCQLPLACISWFFPPGATEDFLGGPVAKTLSSQGRGPKPDQGTRYPHAARLRRLQLKLIHAATKMGHNEKKSCY